MKGFRANYGYVLQNVKKNRALVEKVKPLNDHVFVIAGGTRGIGWNIGKHLMEKGAHVALLGKTTKMHDKLENTIYTAAQKLKDTCTTEAKAIGIECDVRIPESIIESRTQVIERFGNVDGVIINASALCLNNTLNQSQKEINLMTDVNIKGSFNVGKTYLSHLQHHSRHPHLLVIAPPLTMINNPDWWTHHFYYSMSKYNMSLMAKFWNTEFPNVGVNTLWPRTTIDTAPVRNLLGGPDMVNISRTPDIMGTAASIILSSCPELVNGYNFIDDEVCLSADVEVEQFRVNPEINEKILMPDFFC